MTSKFDIIQALERRFDCHVEVRMDSLPGMVYFLDGDTHWILDMNTGLSSKPLPSGKVLMTHPDNLQALYDRSDMSWPSTDDAIRREIESKL